MLQLPPSSVIIYDRENFEVKFKMANKKMDLVINCLEGEDFHASLRVLGPFGRIFQLTKNDMKKKHKLGRSFVISQFRCVIFRF